MKKGISLILALLLALGSLGVLAACDTEEPYESEQEFIPNDDTSPSGEQSTQKPNLDKEDETGEPEQTSETDSTDNGGKEPEQTSETDSTDNGGKEPEETEESTTPPVIPTTEWVVDAVYDVSSFQECIAFVRYRIKNKETEKLELRTSAIDKTGKILWELPIGANDDFPEIMNGTLMLNQQIVYDITGKQIASPESHGYDTIVNRTETLFLAYKMETSFSGNKEYYGIFNNKGEWVVPLESNHQFGGVSWDQCVLISDNELILASKSSGLLGVYHLDSQKITPSYENIFTVKKNSGQPAGVYKCDENGNQTMLLPDYTIVETIMQDGNYANAVYICSKKENEVNHYIALDNAGNILADYGTEYNLSMYDYYNGYLLCAIKNVEGDLYYTIVSPQGTLVFEPILHEGYMHIEPYLYEEGFMTYVHETYTLHDYNGKHTVFTESINGKVLSIVRPFSCGLAHAIYGENHGFIDPTGKIVIDLQNLVIPE